jgi:hypothetical protein
VSGERTDEVVVSGLGQGDFVVAAGEQRVGGAYAAAVFGCGDHLDVMCTGLVLEDQIVTDCEFDPVGPGRDGVLG